MNLHAVLFFFFNDTATTEIYTLSLHDALPIYPGGVDLVPGSGAGTGEDRGASSSSTPLAPADRARTQRATPDRSEEHTSELQSRQYLVCRLLLEKKKKKKHYYYEDTT